LQASLWGEVEALAGAWYGPWAFGVMIFGYPT